MLKKGTLIGLLLAAVGLAVLQRTLAEKEAQQKQIDLYKARYVYDINKYFAQYDQWKRQSAEQKGSLPYGLDRNKEPKSEEQLKRQQQEHLKADLDKLLVAEPQDTDFADMLYGKDWQQQVNSYKKQREKTELILSGSILCTSVGSAVFIWCFLVWFSRLLIKITKKLIARFIPAFMCLRKKIQTRYAKAGLTATQKLNKKAEQAGGYFDVLAKSGWQDVEQKSEKQQSPEREPRPVSDRPDHHSRSQKALALSMRNKWYAQDKRGEKNEKETAQTASAQDSEQGAAVITGRSANNKEKRSGDKGNNIDKTTARPGRPAEDTEKAHIPEGGGYSLKSEGYTYAKSLQKTELQTRKPVEISLAELTRQVSAIREYASSQQERVSRLQDGYDWNIIRKFCLRVIRCIDNLECRISKLAGQDVDTAGFLEIRDELVFALESSGVERFEPQIHSDYRGYERTAEVVKEKQYSDDPAMAGKIAEVVRPGYQYLIDEKNTKVVRAAQVRLFSMAGDEQHQLLQKS